MKIAFLISAHNDAQHLKRLLAALPEEAHCFIHLDSKSDMSLFQDCADGKRVMFITERYDIMWGSFGQVRYQTALLRSALRSPEQFDYFFSISGLDYPLWSNRRIMEYVHENSHLESLYAICLADNPSLAHLYREYRFLNTHSWRYGTWKSRMRVALRHIVKALGFRKPLVIRSGNKEYKLYKGGSWWGITRGLAERVIETYDSEKNFVSYFVNAFGPDETFVHTVAMNSEYASRCTLLDANSENTLEALSPLTYIEYGKEIKVFTEDDYDTLMSSGKMFCRKVMSGKSDKLLDMIDENREKELL